MLTGQAIPSLEMLERRERERKVMGGLSKGQRSGTTTIEAWTIWTSTSRSHPLL
jgi:hypothetical protein